MSAACLDVPYVPVFYCCCVEFPGRYLLPKEKQLTAGNTGVPCFLRHCNSIMCCAAIAYCQAWSG